MRSCRKCGETIPRSKRIDGKSHNLSSRKFCLKCSPFGKHNTRNIVLRDKAIRPIVNGKRIPYSEWCEAAKDDSRARIYWRGRSRREALIRMRGGKCEKCQYGKCVAALHFHHRDPATKLFGLATTTLQSGPWEEILKEAAKCDLLCANCHSEIHDDRHCKYENYRNRFSAKDLIPDYPTPLPIDQTPSES
jgi:hypothetical protein